MGDDETKSTYGDLCEFCVRVLRAVVNYTRTVPEIKIIESLDDQEKLRRAEELVTEFKLIAEELEVLYEKTKELNLNWLIQISAINYAGLARLKQFQIEGNYINRHDKGSLKKYLQKAREDFEKALNICW